jgi:hypothetical protein
MLMCVLLFPFAHETAGAARTRSSLRPLFFRAKLFCKTRAHAVARTRRCVRLSCRAGGHPVFRDASDGIVNSRRTGYPPEPVIGRACARPGGGYDGGGRSVVIARSACDEAIQLFARGLDCFASARNDGFGLFLLTLQGRVKERTLLLPSFRISPATENTLWWPADRAKGVIDLHLISKAWRDA